MNIYLLNRTDKWGYDDFDSFVVVAESDEEAKNLKLGYCDGSSWTTPDKIKVTLLGVASPNVIKGEILGSYNAG